jgi:hypothetical protein
MVSWGRNFNPNLVRSKELPGDLDELHPDPTLPMENIEALTLEDEWNGLL